MSLDKKSLVAFANKERDRFETALRQFVEIPTVSADAERLPDIRRCAELAASTIRDFGGEADILETDGNPIIHGRFNTGSNAADRHRLQPPRRAAGLARDRAVDERSVRLHQSRATATSAAARPTTRVPR